MSLDRQDLDDSLLHFLRSLWKLYQGDRGDVGRNLSQKTQITRLAATSSLQLFLQANSRRRGVYFVPPQSGNYIVKPGNAGGTTGGLTVASNNLALGFLRSDWGAMVTGEWYLFGGLGGSTAEAWEVIDVPGGEL